MSSRVARYVLPLAVAWIQFAGGDGAAAPSDCDFDSTNPAVLETYDPETGPTYVVPVVVHDLVGMFLPEQAALGMINRLNHDYRADADDPEWLWGSNGIDTNIEFRLVEVNVVPAGATRDSWLANDDFESCPYCASLARDPTKYLNIYITNAWVELGFSGFIQGATAKTDPPLCESTHRWCLVGTDSDRVVVDINFIFPENIESPVLNDSSRTVTHEVGHALGLYHVFDETLPGIDNTCQGNLSECYTTGDLICDNFGQVNSALGGGFFFDERGCPINTVTCSSLPASVNSNTNYMNLNYDDCLETFTPEQAMRARCVIDNWRPGYLDDVDTDGDGIFDRKDNCRLAANSAQDDTDIDKCGNRCDADYDNSGVVGIADFGEFGAAFGTYDLEKDHTQPVVGPVGTADFGVFGSYWGKAPGPSGTTGGSVACPWQPF